MKVQFTDYQKLKDRYETLKEINKYRNDAICRLQKQIEKMKNHNNCKWFHEWNLADIMDEPLDDLSPCQGCKNFSLWELAE